MVTRGVLGGVSSDGEWSPVHHQHCHRDQSQCVCHCVTSQHQQCRPLIGPHLGDRGHCDTSHWSAPGCDTSHWSRWHWAGDTAIGSDNISPPSQSSELLWDIYIVHIWVDNCLHKPTIPSVPSCVLHHIHVTVFSLQLSYPIISSWMEFYNGEERISLWCDGGVSVPSFLCEQWAATVSSLPSHWREH